MNHLFSYAEQALALAALAALALGNRRGIESVVQVTILVFSILDPLFSNIPPVQINEHSYCYNNRDTVVG